MSIPNLLVWALCPFQCIDNFLCSPNEGVKNRRIKEEIGQTCPYDLLFSIYFVSVSKFDQRLTTYFIALLFFLLQERSFLLKTLGMESPSPDPSSNPSQPPTCKRALLHSLQPTFLIYPHNRKFICSRSILEFLSSRLNSVSQVCSHSGLKFYIGMLRSAFQEPQIQNVMVHFAILQHI